MALEIRKIRRMAISGVEYGEKIGNEIDQHQRPGLGKPARSWNTAYHSPHTRMKRRGKIARQRVDNKARFRRRDLYGAA